MIFSPLYSPAPLAAPPATYLPARAGWHPSWYHRVHASKQAVPQSLRKQPQADTKQASPRYYIRKQLTQQAQVGTKQSTAAYMKRKESFRMRSQVGTQLMAPPRHAYARGTGNKSSPSLAGQHPNKVLPRQLDEV